MVQNKDVEDAFVKIINHGPSAGLRKSAEGYWAAYQSDDGADDALGVKFQKAIKSVPLDYRGPAIQCLDAFEDSLEKGKEPIECYGELAIAIANRIVHVL